MTGSRRGARFLDERLDAGLLGVRPPGLYYRAWNPVAHAGLASLCPASLKLLLNQDGSTYGDGIRGACASAAPNADDLPLL